MRWKVLRTRHDKTYAYKQGVHNQKVDLISLKKFSRIINTKKDGDLNDSDLRMLSVLLKWFQSFLDFVVIQKSVTLKI